MLNITMLSSNYKIHPTSIIIKDFLKNKKHLLLMALGMYQVYKKVYKNNIRFEQFYLMIDEHYEY
jgi:hypothetical protein